MFGRYRKTAPRTGVRIGPPHAAVKLGTGSAVRSHRRSSAPLWQKCRPTQNRGLRVYLADGDTPPVEVPP
jgi:hypothetical protein